MTGAPTILLSANLAWNLVNFRAGLIHALRESGFALVAAAPPDPAAEKQLADLGCMFEPLRLNAKGMSPLDDLSLIRQYRALMHRYRPVGYLAWTIKPNVYGGIAAAWLRVPHIANVSGLGTAFIRRNLLTLIVERLYHTGLGRASTVFFQNDDDLALFTGKGLVRAEQAHLVPGSGIDCDHFAPGKSVPHEAHTFLMIGRVLRDKGVVEYVDAARELRAAYPDRRFRLLGFLDAENRTAISRAQVDQWVAEGSIEYLPPTDDVRPYIDDADCVVLPSYREGTSRVLLEAAAMARPIVTTDVPGCREVVEHGVNGLLCAARNADALAAAMREMIESPLARLAEMGAAGRTRVIERFSQERVNELYFAALRRAGVAV